MVCFRIEKACLRRSKPNANSEHFHLDNNWNIDVHVNPVKHVEEGSIYLVGESCDLGSQPHALKVIT